MQQELETNVIFYFYLLLFLILVFFFITNNSKNWWNIISKTDYFIQLINKKKLEEELENAMKEKEKFEKQAIYLEKELQRITSGTSNDSDEEVEWQPGNISSTWIFNLKL